MKNVYILADNIISSLGFSSSENIQAIKNEKNGFKKIHDPHLSPLPLPLSLVDTALLDLNFDNLLIGRQSKLTPDSFTRLEKLFILSIENAISSLSLNLSSKRVLLILSTTKGNIDLLEDQFKAKFNHKRLYLWELARVVQDFFGFIYPPLIISNACISGVLAIITASRMIRSGQYDQIVVSGGDIATGFVISGFQSFQALTPDLCRPYDQNRNGLALGEACGTMILSNKQQELRGEILKVMGGATTNDANHISGPSRTGEELSQAIDQSIAESELQSCDMDYISAHGTATPYNDEMESKALSLSHLLKVPVNSFKGYWGHTLGAAGIIESVAATHALSDNYLFRSLGFESLGVTEPINVISNAGKASLNTCLKTASGFGGCNAAVIYQKG